VVIRALTDIFNHSIGNNTIPNIWKTANIVNTVKTNYPLNQPPTDPFAYYVTSSKYSRG